MSDRLILELKSKFKKEILIEEEKDKEQVEINNSEFNKMVDDLQLTLQSLNYKNNEIKNILPIIIKEVDGFANEGNNISFESFLKLAMNYLDKNSSNIDRWRSIIN